jgi:hypothetical protein
MVGDNSFSNLRLSYINFGNMSGSAAIYASTVNGFEFDHNYVYMNGANTDVILHVDQFNGNGYDQNWIHDNTLYSPTGDGYGADGLQMSGQGYSIYNNSIISYISSSWNKSEGQHPDGWQTSGGGYIKIYNNFVYGYQDIGLYGGCWGNAVSGGSHTFSNVQIYNNIVDGQSWQSVGSIEIEADNPTGSTFNNIGIYNNIVRVPAVMSGVQGWGIFVGSSNSGGTWTNISVANNLVIAPTSAQYMALYSTPAVNTNNVEVNDAGAAALLANLQNNSTASDYHYKSTATSLIGKGTNESSIFTMNKDGNLRPSTGAWNVGAY